jgi:hypothetical protein
MNITIDYVRGGNLKNFKVIPIELKLYTAHKILYCANVDTDRYGNISFDIQVPQTNLFFDLSCYDTDIFHCPVLIMCIHFDHFYHLKTFAHHGFPIPIKTNTHRVELVQGNCLFFCGTLQYRWQGPTPQIVMPSRFRWADPR